MQGYTTYSASIVFPFFWKCLASSSADGEELVADVRVKDPFQSVRPHSSFELLDVSPDFQHSLSALPCNEETAETVLVRTFFHSCKSALPRCSCETRSLEG